MVLYIMGLEKVSRIDIVFENCEELSFNPKDVTIQFELSKFFHYNGLSSTGIRNVVLTIKKSAKNKSKQLWQLSWQKRIKIPDITAIYFDEFRFYIEDWPDEEEYVNPNQHVYENENEIKIIISNSKRFIRKNAPRMTRVYAGAFVN